MLKCVSSCGTLTLLLFHPGACAWMTAFMLLRDCIKSEIHYINLNYYHQITILYHLCSYSSSEVQKLLRLNRVCKCLDFN